MPSKPAIFHGRESLVNHMANCLIGIGTNRVSILGPGGMGKTAVALALMEHPKIKEKFEERCFWVPCVEARSPASFLGILAASLHTKHTTSDRLADILSELTADDKPRVLLLDNFETPWDLEDGRSTVEEYLCAIARVAHVAVLITMRSNIPPSRNIKWYRLDQSVLPALDVEAARRVYLDIHPNAAFDSKLDALLDAVGYMPLAITLLASLGSNTDDAPSKLLQEWNNPNVRTDLLDDGQDSQRNVNISVRLSVNSSRMQRDPDAITLLSILARLPGGARKDFLPQLAPKLSSVSKALNFLTTASLAQIRTTDMSIHVQPVVAAYMTRYHPLHEDIVRDIAIAYCDFVDSHNAEIGDVDFGDDSKALAHDESNIEAVLLDAAATHYDLETAQRVLKSLITFCWYQCWNRPRLEVVEDTLRHARVRGLTDTIAEALRCKGEICTHLTKFGDAIEALLEGRMLFLSSDDQFRAARCQMEVATDYEFLRQFDRAEEALGQALSEFMEMNNKKYVAETMLRVGRLKAANRDYEGAMQFLVAARDTFSQLQCLYSVADCDQEISRNCLKKSRYSEGLEAAMSARAQYLALHCGPDASRSLMDIAACYAGQRRYSDALEAYTQTAKEQREFGLLEETAESLEGMAKAQCFLKQFDAARGAFERAQQIYVRCGAGSGQGGTERVASWVEALTDIPGEGWPHGGWVGDFLFLEPQEVS